MGTMSAKNRGESISGCHQGPLNLRPARAPPDRLQWVRGNKQYDPYVVFPPETAKLKKSKGPPTLWLPERNKDSTKLKKARAAASQPATSPQKTLKPDEMSELTGASSSSPSKPKKTPEEILLDRPAWDTEHSVMFSRMNHEVPGGVREYFDVPKRRGENEGCPKVRERYCMNDRQAGWNDEPHVLGESRRTYLSNVGPYNLGGCKEQQLPSYWRKIENWHAHSMPDLALERGISGTRSPLLGDRSLLAAMADTPATQSRALWRGWSKSKTAHPDSYPKDGPPRGWDKRWSVNWSKDNDVMNPRMREYFSVPEGMQGLSTEGKRSGKHYQPYGQTQKLGPLIGADK